MIQNNVIRSDDPQAVEKLQAKLDKLTKQHARMKEINAYFKKHATALGCPGSPIRLIYSAATQRKCADLGSALRRCPEHKTRNMQAGIFRAVMPRQTRKIIACACILTESPRRNSEAS